EPSEAAPMIRHRPAAVRNDQLEIREILEDVRRHQLHERDRVGAEIVRAGGLPVRRVAGAADMDHPGHLELAHLLVERIPVAVAEGRTGEITAGRVGIHVAADEAELEDAALELAHRAVDRSAGRLRQLSDADEIPRVELRQAVDQIVTVLGPRLARRLVADVMSHPARTRGKQRHVGAALALQLELGAFDALPQLIVADVQGALHCPSVRVTRELGLLPLAILAELLRRSRVVSVAIDDHRSSGLHVCESDEAHAKAGAGSVYHPERYAVPAGGDARLCPELRAASYSEPFGPNPGRGWADVQRGARHTVCLSGSHTVLGGVTVAQIVSDTGTDSARAPRASAPLEPAGPSGLPYFGCLDGLLRNPMAFWLRIANRYG